MPDNKTITLSRKQIYTEIWELSVAGVARKYDIPYTRLIKACKEADIPIPSSGYWTKLEAARVAERIDLPESNQTELVLPVGPLPKRQPRKKIVMPSDKKPVSEIQPTDPVIQNTSVISVTAGETNVTSTPEDEPESYCEVTGITNTYERQTLYNEVWTQAVVQVAKKYGVSDVAIHKVCKSLNIPVPPRGYWAKLRAGKPVEKTPLPKTEGRIAIWGTRSYEGVKPAPIPSDALDFLDVDERQKVLSIAENMQVPDENESLHPMIRLQKKKLKEYDEQKKATYPNNRNQPQPPLLADAISDEQLHRVFRILGALFQAVEALGGCVNEDLSLQIRGERVRYSVAEGQTKVEHVLTKDEAKALLQYEDERKRHSWATKPQIRKYDYVYNGRLRICVLTNKYHRDNDKQKIESMLGNILLDLYTKSEDVRKARIKWEEEQRRREEEARRKEERQKKYNAEVEQTNALVNMAEDYHIACKIRTFVRAVSERDDIDDETKEWVSWAKKKADWYDPTIGRKDECFGERDHEKDSQSKILKKVGYYW